MNTLGKRIKSIRKKKKLTLEKVCGKSLSVGMLSLIENDKAQPSMESLTYIARKLDVEVNELLQEFSTYELKEISQSMEENYKNKKYKEVYNLGRKLVNEDLPIFIESGKILELYGKSLHHLKMGESINYLYQADEVFMSLNLFNKSAKILSFIIWAKLKEFNYEGALLSLLEQKENYKEKEANLDIVTELDIHYNEIMLLFAVGRYEKAVLKLDEAIVLSNQKGVFYRIGDLYRIACFYAMMNGEEKKVDFYLHKLELLGEFTGCKETKSLVLIIQAHFYIEFKKIYSMALNKLEEFKEINGEEGINYYVMEKGKLLYGLKEYDSALQYLLQFEDVAEWLHPFDLSIMFEVDAYIARCYHALGENKLAVKYAETAFMRAQKLPDTLYKTFIYETYERII